MIFKAFQYDKIESILKYKKKKTSIEVIRQGYAIFPVIKKIYVKITHSLPVKSLHTRTCLYVLSYTVCYSCLYCVLYYVL